MGEFALELTIFPDSPAGKPTTFRASALGKQCPAPRRRGPSLLLLLLLLLPNVLSGRAGSSILLDYFSLGLFFLVSKWLWVKIKPPGIGPQVLVHVFPFTRASFWAPTSDPQPNEHLGLFDYQYSFEINLRGSPHFTERRTPQTGKHGCCSNPV